MQSDFSLREKVRKQIHKLLTPIHFTSPPIVLILAAVESAKWFEGQAADEELRAWTQTAIAGPVVQDAEEGQVRCQHRDSGTGA